MLDIPDAERDLAGYGHECGEQTRYLTPLISARKTAIIIIAVCFISLCWRVTDHPTGDCALFIEHTQHLAGG